MALHHSGTSKSIYYNIAMDNRRDFIKRAAASSAGIAVSGAAFGFSAKSYVNIIGANERIHVAMIGLNGRGTSMAGTFAKQKNAEVAVVCDVDSRAMPKAADAVTKGGQATAPRMEKDCRKVLEDKSIDAIYIATPDHWHVTMKRTKALLKDTYRPILPEHLFTLDKASFYPPLAKWIRREAAPLVENMLENKHIQELFDVEVVRDIFEKHKAHKQYGLHTLSTLMQLSNWFETVYDA